MAARVPFRGRTTCSCMAEWLPIYEQMLLKAFERGLRQGFLDEGGELAAVGQLVAERLAPFGVGHFLGQSARPSATAARRSWLHSMMSVRPVLLVAI